MLFKELLVKIATELDRAGIDYMVIGGQAVLVYGEPRPTINIDIISEVVSSQDRQSVSKLLIFRKILKEVKDE